MNIRTRRKLTVVESRRKKLSLWRTIRYYYLRLLRLEGTPKVIARGLACGVFAGCFPWFGLQTIIGVLLAFVFKGNKLAAALGTWVSNPLTYAPLFFFNYKLGEFIQGHNNSGQTRLELNGDWSKVIELGTDMLLSLFIGSFIVGIIGAIATYFISINILLRKRRIYKK